MKRILQSSTLRRALALSYLLTIAVSQAAVKTTIFNAPTEYCILKTELRGELDKTTLDHNLVIDTPDHFKNGNIFVGFRLKSKPEAL